LINFENLSKNIRVDLTEEELKEIIEFLSSLDEDSDLKKLLEEEPIKPAKTPPPPPKPDLKKLNSGKIVFKQKRYRYGYIREKTEIQVLDQPQEDWKIKKYIPLSFSDQEWEFFRLLFETFRTVRISQTDFEKLVDVLETNRFPLNVKHLYVEVIFKKEDGFVYLKKTADTLDFYRSEKYTKITPPLPLNIHLL